MQTSGKLTSARSFKDSTLKSSLFLLELVAAIETRAVSWEMVVQGDSKEDMLVCNQYFITTYSAVQYSMHVRQLYIRYIDTIPHGYVWIRMYTHTPI